MRWLELRIPPPAVVLLIAALAYGASRALPALHVESDGSAPLALAVALAGFAVALAGVLGLRRHRTTISPLHPERCSALVVDGIYRHTRNPMYLGLALLLLAFALWRRHPPALLGVPLFVAYITRFQILPEERALSARFGAEYDAYRARVRRWL